MADTPSELDLKSWHRRFAVDANNRAWALAEQTTLSDAERTELLHAAHASAHHWSKIATGKEVARADLLLGRVHAILGHGDLAMRHASAAFEALGATGNERWEIAFAHAILAGAAAASGDHALHARRYAEAQARGNALAAPEDREIFLKTFRLIPAPR
jgi:hypothetical protein